MAGATTERLSQRVAVFEAVRRNRASALQVLSNAGQDEAHKVAAEAARYIPIETVPSACAFFPYCGAVCPLRNWDFENANLAGRAWCCCCRKPARVLPLQL